MKDDFIHFDLTNKENRRFLPQYKTLISSSKRKYYSNGLFFKEIDEVYEVNLDEKKFNQHEITTIKIG